MSNLIDNISLHRFFDGDQPWCLYCKAQCKMDGTGTTTSFLGGYNILYVDTFNCIKCGEIFGVYTSETGIVNHSFMFTCQDIEVRIYYDTENFSLSTTDSAQKIWINDLSNVEFNFSNKEKLYNKLKTYLTFA